MGRFTVIGENNAMGNTGLRPDLVISRGEEAIIIDIACPFDNRLVAFKEARREKERKYVPVQQHLLRRFQRVSIEAIIVGALGSWDHDNNRIMHRLWSMKYLKKLKKLAVSDVIAASRDIYARHISGASV